MDQPTLFENKKDKRVEAQEKIREQLDLVKRGRKRNILRYFLAHPGIWYQVHEMHQFFGDPKSEYFVGQNWRRRLQEYTENELIQTRPAEKGKNVWGIP